MRDRRIESLVIAAVAAMLLLLLLKLGCVFEIGVFGDLPDWLRRYC